MSEDKVDIRAVLEAHARRDDLARLVRTVALSAADERRARFSDGLDELLREVELEPEDGVVGTFNVLRALSSTNVPEAPLREVLGRLLLRGVQLDLDADTTEADDKAWVRIAESLCWLSANTQICGLSFVDAELESAQAARLWSELGAVVTRADASGATKGRGEAMMAAAALVASKSPPARAAVEALRASLGDPLIRAAFAAPAPTSADAEPLPAPKAPTELSGEIVPAPLGPFGLVLWTATGLIFVRYLLRFIANVVLRCRRPVEVTVAAAGVTLKSKLDVLGKTIRTRETHIPMANLAHAEREVRYPRLALYAGLVALAVGTFFGVSLATDGVRAGSPSLLGLGAGIFALGVVVDLVFSIVLPGKLGRHRVIFVPRKGRSVAVRIADESAADRALRALVST